MDPVAYLHPYQHIFSQRIPIQSKNRLIMGILFQKSKIKDVQNMAGGSPIIDLHQSWVIGSGEHLSIRMILNIPDTVKLFDGFNTLNIVFTFALVYIPQFDASIMTGWDNLVVILRIPRYFVDGLDVFFEVSRLDKGLTDIPDVEGACERGCGKSVIQERVPLNVRGVLSDELTGTEIFVNSEIAVIAFDEFE